MVVVSGDHLRIDVGCSAIDSILHGSQSLIGGPFAHLAGSVLPHNLRLHIVRKSARKKYVADIIMIGNPFPVSEPAILIYIFSNSDSAAVAKGAFLEF